MNKKLNVVDLGAFKELKDLRRTVDSFETYLRTLSQNQLQVEVNYLLDDNSPEINGMDYFSRGQLIMKEISSRADHMVKPKIELFINR